MLIPAPAPARLAAVWLGLLAGGAAIPAADLEADFRHPPETTRPWVFWYWLNAAVSRAGITAALRPGADELRIAVTNTWANRLNGDHALPETQRLTWTTAPYRLEGKPLLPAGLLGPVAIMEEQ